MKSCKWEEKEKREVVNPGWGGNMKLHPPEQQPGVLTTTPCHLLFMTSLKAYYLLYHYCPCLNALCLSVNVIETN
jgi:hypothetical protein